MLPPHSRLLVSTRFCFAMLYRIPACHAFSCALILPYVFVLCAVLVSCSLALSLSLSLFGAMMIPSHSYHHTLYWPSSISLLSGSPLPIPVAASESAVALSHDGERFLFGSSIVRDLVNQCRALLPKALIFTPGSRINSPLPSKCSTGMSY